MGGRMGRDWRVTDIGDSGLRAIIQLDFMLLEPSAEICIVTYKYHFFSVLLRYFY